MKKILVKLGAGYLVVLGLLMLGSFVYTFYHPVNNGYLYGPNSKFLSPGMLLFLVAWTIATGVGLFLVKEWARFSVLLLSTLNLVMGSVAGVSILLTQQRGSAGDLKTLILACGILLFVIIPGLLIALFNNKGVKEIFALNDQGGRSSLIPAGIKVFALFQILGGIKDVGLIFNPLATYVIVGPWIIEGTGSKIYLAFVSILTLYVGIGLFLLHKRAWQAAVLMQGVYILASLAGILTASYSMVELINDKHPGPVPVTLSQYQGVLTFSIIGSSLLIAYLVSRKKFLPKPAAK